MSRKLFIAGNWKMNTDLAAGVELAEALVKKVGSLEEIDIAVCPPFVYLGEISCTLADSNVALSRRTCSTKIMRAFTGEISGEMLKDVCCEYVILGHSERRHVIGEGDELINRKLVKALADDLLPIFCIGELLEEQGRQRLDVVPAARCRSAWRAYPSPTPRRLRLPTNRSGPSGRA